MEKHIDLPEEYKQYQPLSDELPKDWFSKAVKFTEKFYLNEISRASNVDWNTLDPDTFFQECIWVIHATGFSAKAVSRFIPKLISAYGKYDILAKENEERYSSRVLPICNNIQKARSIHKISVELDDGIRDVGWEKWKSSNLDKVDKLSRLPYIGKVTQYHLGRNIGMLGCVKPDLHLIRMAKYWGYKDCESMIQDISDGYLNPSTNKPIELGIADMIAWYYASTFGTIQMKKDGVR